MKTFKEQDHFEVLRRIDKDPKASQRKLAEDLGFSLGKLNYCLKALQRKGLVKFKNFQKKTDKISPEESQPRKKKDKGIKLKPGESEEVDITELVRECMKST